MLNPDPLVRAAFLATTVLTLVGAPSVRACDMCAIYTATAANAGRTGPWLAVSEQFTSYNTLRDGDEKLDNEFNEWLQSSITQFVIGYAFHPRFGLQINVPLISREYRRVEDGEPVHGDETGLGDISVLGRFTGFESVGRRSLVRIDLIGGLKLPTGDSDRLDEELEHDDDFLRAAQDSSAGGRAGHDSGEEASGVHGHDLALGSGSTDGIIGINLFTAYRRSFFDTRFQYAMRGDGDSDYEYANDLTWDAGPGVFLRTGHPHTLALQAVASGETKGKDTQAGERLNDSAATFLFLGPRILYSFAGRLHAEISSDWPVVRNVTSVQLVPDWRTRAALVWTF